MISKIYWIKINELAGDLLGIMPRPRGNDWLEDEIKWLKIRGVDLLVSLLERSEIDELGLEREEEICGRNEINFVNYPIEDVNLPSDEDSFLALIDSLEEQLQKSKKIVIHCRMGIGRSSVLASGLLIRLGINPLEVFEIISTFRELEVPDTEAQKQWVFSLSNKIKNGKK